MTCLQRTCVWCLLLFSQPCAARMILGLVNLAAVGQQVGIFAVRQSGTGGTVRLITGPLVCLVAVVVRRERTLLFHTG